LAGCFSGGRAETRGSFWAETYEEPIPTVIKQQSEIWFQGVRCAGGEKRTPRPPPKGQGPIQASVSGPAEYDNFGRSIRFGLFRPSRPSVQFEHPLRTCINAQDALTCAAPMPRHAHVRFSPPFRAFSPDGVTVRNRHSHSRTGWTLRSKRPMQKNGVPELVYYHGLTPPYGCAKDKSSSIFALERACWLVRGVKRGVPKSCFGERRPTKTTSSRRRGKENGHALRQWRRHTQLGPVRPFSLYGLQPRALPISATGRQRRGPKSTSSFCMHALYDAMVALNST